MTELIDKQVQCQRSRKFLMVDRGPVLRCGWCDDGETYERLEPMHEASVHVHAAADICRAEFGVPHDGRAMQVWLGDHPETVFEAHLDRYNVYLGRHSDRWQLMYSGAHEAFHRVCGRGKNSIHWADEMFAVLYSLTYLELIQEAAHAARCRFHLLKEAELCTRAQMFAMVDKPMPEGIYGRTYVVGQELADAVGWEELKPLATMRDKDGRCDVNGWLDSLGVRRTAATTVLGASLPRACR